MKWFHDLKSRPSADRQTSIVVDKLDIHPQVPPREEDFGASLR
jgi:hypothetical protein